MKYAIMMQKVVDVAGIFSWEVTMVKLIKGESDLATLHPDLVKEWHPIKNGDLMPEDISSGSGKEVWWLCPEGHTYSMVVNQRTKRGYGCPYCSGHRAIRGINDLATSNPELSEEWNYEKNNNLTPYDVTAGATKRCGGCVEKVIHMSNLLSNEPTEAIDADALRHYADRVSVFHQLEPKVYLTTPTTAPTIDFDALRQEWMDKDNQEFILSCLDFMKTHGLFTDKSLETLQDKEQCAVLFRHNSLNGILLCVNPNQPDDEQRKDANGNARYYSEKYIIAENEYFVSSEWRPDREDARKPLIDWIFALMQEIKFNTGYQSEFPRNRILFGAPGTGKSFTLNHEKDDLLTDGGEYERVTFHPDYSYANFVGTYKPVPCKDSDGKDAITYSYVPGPFMRTYVKALQNSRTDAPKPFLLVIEEINRANVAAVFGDVFQLLDRGDDEVSEYPIQASEDIKKYLAEELGGNPDDYAEIRIPDNMFIWATMNSADQGVFPMDTAFKRRWDFTYLGIDDSEAGIVGKKVVLGQGDYRRVVEWNALRKAINNELLTYKVNEDKLMGPYFISKKNLPEGEMIDPAVFTRIFKNKVIMYLFDDAAKQKRITLFGGCDEKAKNQYSKICREFDTKGVYIFCEGISSQFIDNVPEDDGE